MSAPPARGARLVALDVARGFTMVWMMLVDNQGGSTPGSVYAAFLEADWQGFGPAVTVFPTFLFLAGCSMVLALAPHAYGARAAAARGGLPPAPPAGPDAWWAHRVFCPRKPASSRLVVTTRILYRAAKLFAFGAFLNLWAGGFDFPHWVYLGVLQRIAACYAAAALLYVLTPLWVLPLSAAVAVAAWCGLLYFYPVPGSCGAGALLDPYCNAAAYIDRLVLGVNHVPGGGYLPEGLVSSLTAYATVVIGAGFGLVLRATKGRPGTLAGRWLALACLLGGAAGGISTMQPLIKKIWTPAFALAAAAVSGGVCVAALLAADVDWCGGRRASASGSRAGEDSLLAAASAPLLAHQHEVYHNGPPAAFVCAPASSVDDPAPVHAASAAVVVALPGEDGDPAPGGGDDDPAPPSGWTAPASVYAAPRLAGSGSLNAAGSVLELTTAGSGAYPSLQQQQPPPNWESMLLHQQLEPAQFTSSSAALSPPSTSRQKRRRGAWCLPGGARAKLLTPLVWLGRNAAVVFIGMVGLEILLMDTLHIQTDACWVEPPLPPWAPCPSSGTSPWAWSFHIAVQATGGDLQAASSLVAAAHTLLWTGVCAVLYRCNVFVVM